MYGCSRQLSWRHRCCTSNGTDEDGIAYIQDLSVRDSVLGMVGFVVGVADRAIGRGTEQQELQFTGGV